MERHEFAQLQLLPYDYKIQRAIRKAREFQAEISMNYGRYEWECGNVHVSVGGLDSITLLVFLRKYVNPEMTAVSVSALEDKSIQATHKVLGVEVIKPLKSKTEVIREFGFPVISKAKARKIECLQDADCPKQTFIHAIMTGEMGKQGKFQHSDKIKLPDKWLELFGGHYADHRPDLRCQVAPFRVSDRCCHHMKEKPCGDWAKEHNSYPYLGLMASEGGQRELGLIKNGCNYYGKNSVRSCPFAIFTRQDLLRLALELNVPVPKIYGKIAQKDDGTLYTTRAQRTGCSMCGFGIHIEDRPHRFDRLYEDNPAEWDYWMNHCAIDYVTGEAYGWGRVLDYIGVGWRQTDMEIAQMTMGGFG